MPKLLRFHFLFCLFLAVGRARAQRLPLDTYTPANGLIDTRVIKMFQDSRGRMFFLTREGFSVFDGQRFDNYHRIGNVETGMCNDVLENNDHSVSIYSFTGYIFNYSESGIRVDSSHREELSEFTRIIPLGPGENLLCTNYYLYLEKNNRFTKLNTALPGAQFLYPDQLTVFKQYLVFNKWADTENRKLFLYDIRQQQFKDQMYIPVPGRIATHNNGNIMVYEQQWRQLDSIMLTRGRFKTGNTSFQQWMPKDFNANSIFFDHNNDIWLINGEKGCCRINHLTGEKKYYLVADGLLNGVSGIFQDREHNFWFIAPGRGVQKLHQSPLSEVGSYNGKPLSYVAGIYSLPGNYFAIHTYGKIINGEKEFSSSQNNFHFSWQGEVWQTGGGRLLGVSSQKVIQLNNHKEFVPPLSNQYSGHYTEDREGRLLISGGLLIAIDKSFRVTIKQLPYFTDNIIVDAQNNYWCFMRNNEVALLQWQQGSLNIAAIYSTPLLNPRFALLWKPGVFAVGTRHRGIRFLSVFNGKLLETGGIAREQGLSNSFVHALALRNGNELVAGTANGLDVVQVNGKDTLVKRIAAGSNLFSGFTSLAMAPGGIVYGRSEDGLLYRLENTVWEPSGFRPQLGFRSVYVNGEEKNIATDTRFAYTRNNFRFSVSCASFLDNKNIRFRFRLKGRGRNWEQEALLPDFEINNLEPGRYMLEVTVQYPGRVYPDETISYHFAILQPLWKRWWAITAMAIFFTAVIALVIRAYLRRKLEKQKAAFEQQQAIERERTRIATDMHDDFGAGLSRIKFISEKILLRHRGNEQLQPDLEKISGYSDEMAEKMGEIIWALNQKYDTYSDTVAFCRAYASEYLESYNITMMFDATPEEQQLKGEVRRNLFLVIKEALYNTVKHARASQVAIGFSIKEKNLYLHIHDNGKGMDEHYTRPFSNGIDNMKKRVNEIGGTISCSNTPGFTVDIVIPVHNG